jgi:hypothetical protein
MPFAKTGLVLKSGLDRDKTGSSFSWKQRTLVVESEDQTLQIYADTDKGFENVLAFLDVAFGAQIEETVTNKAHSFRVTTGEMVWELAVTSAAEKDAWIKTIKEHALQRRSAFSKVSGHLRFEESGPAS